MICMERKKKVRLSDIADKLNISTVTVSKALSNKEGVGDDLRKQIKDLAEEMGYRVKSSFSNDGKITGNIGIIIPNKYFSDQVSFYWHIFNHISKELLSRSYYTIMELLSAEDESNFVLPRLLQDKKVDGYIVLGEVNAKYIDMLNEKYPNFVLLDFYTHNNNYDSVSNDNYYCSYHLTSYVISQGHKNIRFVGNFKATTSIRDRFMGFMKAMLENGLDVSVDSIINDRDENGSMIPIKLPLDNMPTCFVCNNDGTAITVIEELQKSGYKVPEDISVTGFDNYIAQGVSPVSLTTVYVRPEDTAIMVSDLIIKKVTGEPYMRGRHLVSGSILINDSVKKL